MPRRRVAKLTAGKARYVSPNRGLALLDEALDQIALQAKAPNGQWDQENWRCGTGMCLAGWIVQLAGGEWFSAADTPMDDYLIAAPGEKASFERAGTRIVHVGTRATSLLGIDDDALDEEWLFGPDNTLDRLRGMRDALAASGRIK